MNYLQRNKSYQLSHESVKVRDLELENKSYFWLHTCRADHVLIKSTRNIERNCIIINIILIISFKRRRIADEVWNENIWQLKCKLYVIWPMQCNVVFFAFYKMIIFLYIVKWKQNEWRSNITILSGLSFLGVQNFKRYAR